MRKKKKQKHHLISFMKSNIDAQRCKPLKQKYARGAAYHGRDHASTPETAADSARTWRELVLGLVTGTAGDLPAFATSTANQASSHGLDFNLAQDDKLAPQRASPLDGPPLDQYGSNLAHALSSLNFSGQPSATDPPTDPSPSQFSGFLLRIPSSMDFNGEPTSSHSSRDKGKSAGVAHMAINPSVGKILKLTPPIVAAPSSGLDAVFSSDSESSSTTTSG
ncbi:hypothetical protein RJ639_016083 [Escallonia herrerae]|uniref:Uncharacterized protein n=1 Tax=Escallonia herrerae TaxID=1293975 RepID=A0AA89AL88_9ASTE|nr:hypothetical protein RJ639_016083 [Escallonia herrerae]